MSEEIKGKCALGCGNSGDLHDHHIIPRNQGGKGNPENLVRICADCHYKIHHPEWTDGDIEQFKPEYKEALRLNILSDGYGIIPNKVLRDRTITPFAKLLYCEISSLCAQRGYCWANNRYFVERFGKDARTISRAITELEKYLIFENRSSNRRKMWAHSVTDKPRQNRPSNLDKNVHVDQDKNVAHNNKSINIKKNRAEAPPKKTPKDEASQFFTEPSVRDGFVLLLVNKGWPMSAASEEMAKFVSYWTELTPSGRRQRWETQKAFEVRRRLATWMSKAAEFRNGHRPQRGGIAGMNR